MQLLYKTPRGRLPGTSSFPGSRSGQLQIGCGGHLPASLLLFHSLWSRGRRKQRESGCRTVHIRKEGSWTGLLIARSPKLCILGKRRALLCIHWNSGHYRLFSCSGTTNSGITLTKMQMHFKVKYCKLFKLI